MEYRFSVRIADIEAMWDFTEIHQINLHYVRTRMPAIELRERYTYEAFMCQDTYLLFKLSVPDVRLES